MSGAQPPPVAPVDGTRMADAGAVLARAFHEYPLFREILPDERRRAKALLWYMGFVLRYCRAYGEVLGAGDRALIAFLNDPRQFTRRRLLACGYHLGPLKMGFVPFWRLLGHSNHVASLSARLIPRGAWYLWAIGVERAARGRGLGHRLMERFVEAADAAGAACSCDTDRPEMLGFFAAHGFRAVHEGLVPRTELRFWILLRPARPAPPSAATGAPLSPPGRGGLAE